MVLGYIGVLEYSICHCASINLTASLAIPQLQHILYRKLRNLALIHVYYSDIISSHSNNLPRAFRQPASLQQKKNRADCLSRTRDMILFHLVIMIQDHVNYCIRSYTDFFVCPTRKTLRCMSGCDQLQCRTMHPAEATTNPWERRNDVQLS